MSTVPASANNVSLVVNFIALAADPVSIWAHVYIFRSFIVDSELVLLVGHVKDPSTWRAAVTPVLFVGLRYLMSCAIGRSIIHNMATRVIWTQLRRRRIRRMWHDLRVFYTPMPLRVSKEPALLFGLLHWLTRESCCLVCNLVTLDVALHCKFESLM